jgi:uncharacterized protein with HEPN domain
MAARSAAPRLHDIIQAVGHIRDELALVNLDAFEADWRKRWIVERGIEIISEASRRLTDDLRDRHPEIPWQRVAGIGNILRHNYERVAADVLWSIAHDHLPELEKVCREEMAREVRAGNEDSK